ncbi:hypothetical protein EJP77_13850 [Paenibacillus zeisoli]|uniref:Uncharacterized protein n=1 Tax=Paenibacillus zeisoli TaxID=2496267 RepID=A0A3S1CY67_9BACL|nr:hypothetical protein [Paenibacillus zeisoli]RUT29892.1 hypothetical protein EJP77_13850 [Paenibacillus zeisoli]
MKRKGYMYYIIWIIGALLLLYYGNHYLGEVAHQSEVDFNIKRVVWVSAAFALILGIYLSALFGLPGRSNFNKPMFIAVFLPSFILLIYVLLSSYTKMPEIPYYADIIGRNGHFFLGVISGLSLIKSLFEPRR